MSTEQYTYVGPYIRLHKRPMDIKKEVNYCPGGHKRQQNNKYCNVCGSKIQTKYQPKVIRAGLPEFLKEHPQFDYDRVMDALQIIPDDFNQTYETLIPRNGDPGQEFCEQKFETVFGCEEIEALATEFDSDNRDLINAMGEWSRVEVLFGVLGYRW